jgi:membrane-bound ClpP family serine protease
MLDAKGLCPAHRPGATERLREAGRKGAEVSTRLKQKATGLPPLDSPKAAATWLEAIGRAVACGRLANRDAVAATKAVREWLRAHEAGALAEQVTELGRKVEELKKGGQLEVVK